MSDKAILRKRLQTGEHAEAIQETTAKLRQVSKVLNRIHSYLDAQWIHPPQGKLPRLRLS